MTETPICDESVKSVFFHYVVIDPNQATARISSF
jgi:hypothetical protein